MNVTPTRTPKATNHEVAVPATQGIGIGNVCLVVAKILLFLLAWSGLTVVLVLIGGPWGWIISFGGLFQIAKLFIKGWWERGKENTAGGDRQT